MRNSILFLVLVVSLVSANQASAAGGKVLLGQHDVGPGVSKLVTSVGNCGNNLDAVRLRVKDSALKVIAAGVIFSDGASKRVSISRSFAVDYKSPWIGLKFLGAAADKCVKAVFVEAQATSAGGRLKIEGWTK